MEKNNKWNIGNSFCTACAALKASFVIQILHPLDVIRTRLQSHDGNKVNNLVPKYKGILNACKQIYKSEGIPGLYKGMLFSLIAQTTSSFIFFGLIEIDFGRDSNKAIFMGSIYSGVISTTVTQPLWVIKTRILLNTTPKISGFENLKYTANQIFTQHGFKGYFRGIKLSLLLSGHGVIQIQIYEKLDIFSSDYFHNLKPLLNGMVSKIIASTILYPLVTVRTRIQQNQFLNTSNQFTKENSKYKNEIDIIKKVVKLEGIKGFYKGLVPSLFRTVPSNALFFFFYELFKKNSSICLNK